MRLVPRKASLALRAAKKDDELAAETRAVEQNEALSAQESRGRIKEIVERRYTAPAKSG